MDELFDKAFAIVLRDGLISCPVLQRELVISGGHATDLNHMITAKLIQEYKSNHGSEQARESVGPADSE